MHMPKEFKNIFIKRNGHGPNSSHLAISGLASLASPFETKYKVEKASIIFNIASAISIVVMALALNLMGCCFCSRKPFH